MVKLSIGRRTSDQLFQRGQFVGGSQLRNDFGGDSACFQRLPKSGTTQRPNPGAQGPGSIPHGFKRPQRQTEDECLTIGGADFQYVRFVIHRMKPYRA